MLNSTISGNSAAQGNGGGLRSGTNQNQTYVIHSTFSNNLAANNGGAMDISNGAPISLIGAIVAGNTAEFGLGNEIANTGIISANHNNLFGTNADDNASAFTDFIPGPLDINTTLDGAVTKPLVEILEPLFDNGGATPTHAIPSSSLAINAGDRSFCINNQIVTDQRGVERDDNRCDIGAFEGVAEPVEPQCFVVPLGDGKASVFCL